MNVKTPSPRLRGLIATAAFTALASSFSAAGAAADRTGALMSTVKYSDLNVSTAQGAAALYARIRWAARTVCRPLDRRDLLSQALKADCINHAIANAVTEVNQPALFAVYNAHNRTPLPMTLSVSR